MTTPPGQRRYAVLAGQPLYRSTQGNSILLEQYGLKARLSISFRLDSKYRKNRKAVLRESEPN